MTHEVSQELLAHYGRPIADLLADPAVTEICVNRYDQVWAEREGRLERVAGVGWRDEAALVALIKQIAHSLGQEVSSERNPILDARLEDGTRINANLRPIAVHGPNLTVRPYPKQVYTAGDLIGFGSLTAEMLEVLAGAVQRRLNLVIAGGTGSGKTTVLRALCRYIPPWERVLTVEDTAENLLPAHPHLVSYEAARRPGSPLRREITMGTLIENALRQRPDRLVVGEIRTPDAAAAYLDGLNTGHAGILTTIHANGGADALTRLDVLYARQAANLNMAVVERLVRANVDLVAHIARERSGEGVQRRLKAIVWVGQDSPVPLAWHRTGAGYNLDSEAIAQFQQGWTA